MWKFDGEYWIWIAGSKYINQEGKYYVKGVTGPNYYPGGRRDAVVWVDSEDTVYLFGGLGKGAYWDDGITMIISCFNFIRIFK